MSFSIIASNSLNLVYLLRQLMACSCQSLNLF